MPHFHKASHAASPCHILCIHASPAYKTTIPLKYRALAALAAPTSLGRVGWANCTVRWWRSLRPLLLCKRRQSRFLTRRLGEFLFPISAVSLVWQDMDEENLGVLKMLGGGGVRPSHFSSEGSCASDRELCARQLRIQWKQIWKHGVQERNPSLPAGQRQDPWHICEATRRSHCFVSCTYVWIVSLEIGQRHFSTLRPTAWMKTPSIAWASMCGALRHMRFAAECEMSLECVSVSDPNDQV